MIDNCFKMGHSMYVYLAFEGDCRYQTLRREWLWASDLGAFVFQNFNWKLRIFHILGSWNMEVQLFFHLLQWAAGMGSSHLWLQKRPRVLGWVNWKELISRSPQNGRRGKNLQRSRSCNDSHCPENIHLCFYGIISRPNELKVAPTMKGNIEGA